MSRNTLYLVIGGLAVVVALIGFQYYQEQQKTSTIQIDVGKEGLTVETK